MIIVNGIFAFFYQVVAKELNSGRLNNKNTSVFCTAFQDMVP